MSHALGGVARRGLRNTGSGPPLAVSRRGRYAPSFHRQEAAVFIEEYLKELRRDGFSPAAFARYAHRVALLARENLDANPGGVRAVWSVALGFFAVAFIASSAVALWVERGLAYELLLWTSVW